MKAALGRSGLGETLCLEDAHVLLEKGWMVHFLQGAGRELCLLAVALRAC